MDWYVLHVLTGKEQEVGNRLQLLDIKPLIPSCEVMERRNQQWEPVTKLLFTGYVFLQVDLSPRLYYRIKDIPSVIRFLGLQEGVPTTVPPDEMEPWLILGNDGQPFGVSEGEKVNGKTQIRSGPLMPLADKIMSVDARQRRAKIELKVMGQTRLVTVGLEIKSSSDQAADDKSPCEEKDEQTDSQKS